MSEVYGALESFPRKNGQDETPCWKILETSQTKPQMPTMSNSKLMEAEHWVFITLSGGCGNEFHSRISLVFSLHDVASVLHHPFAWVIKLYSRQPWAEWSKENTRQWYLALIPAPFQSANTGALLVNIHFLLSGVQTGQFHLLSCELIALGALEREAIRPLKKRALLKLRLQTAWRKIQSSKTHRRKNLQNLACSWPSVLRSFTKLKTMVGAMVKNNNART